jgi:hypothetical protein
MNHTFVAPRVRKQDFLDGGESDLYIVSEAMVDPDSADTVWSGVLTRSTDSIGATMLFWIPDVIAFTNSARLIGVRLIEPIVLISPFTSRPLSPLQPTHRLDMRVVAPTHRNLIGQEIYFYYLPPGLTDLPPRLPE